MTTPRRLPDFLIIGAAKAATTWIVHQLQQHPDVFLPGPEPHYFSSAFDLGPDWYAAWFAAAGRGQLVGEKSADYLAHPEAPARIAAMLPDVKLVVQLRNPIERAYSDYCMFYRRGMVDKPPESYLRHDATLPRFLEDGLYHRHLARWLEVFPRDRIALILHEDIRAQPETVIAMVSRHLGIAPRIAEQEVVARVNDSQAPILPLALRTLLAPVKDRVAPLRDRAWFRAAHAAIARPPRYPPLTADLRRRLRDFYHDDVLRLGALLGRDVSPWLAVDDRVAGDRAA
ncbi:sulfotransferase [Sandarakinorhabdus sp. DWP1-3-1]|uniref:sulfotransferase n=1 Tax=Sandarakinorhabdus sp. DWP1-3-1 TaxID=2804627 RepID=UPI003CF1B3DB